MSESAERDARPEAGVVPDELEARQEESRRERSRGQPESVTALVRRLIEDIATLFRKELAMASSEVLRSIDEARTGVANILGGAAVLYAGLLFLMLAAMFGLANVVAAWLSALIVGGVAVVIGAIMLQVSRSKLRSSSFAPERTVESLRKDREMIGRQRR